MSSHAAEYWKELANQLLTMEPPHLVEVSRMSSQQTYKIVKVSAVGKEWLAKADKPLMLVLSRALEAYEDREKWAETRKRDVLSGRTSQPASQLPQLALTSVHQGPRILLSTCRHTTVY